ncbi:MAG TPA: hypothetical protein VF559_00135 [Caulobacteraceae bacterium]|jgi:hypothetical protein
MSLKDAFTEELTRKEECEEAARRPYEEAHAKLKALFHEIMSDRDFRTSLRAEVQLNGDELQIDPGPILIRATVDRQGDYAMTYEIKHHEEPEIRTVEVTTIPDIEKAIARLLVEYRSAT